MSLSFLKNIWVNLHCHCNTPRWYGQIQGPAISSGIPSPSAIRFYPILVDEASTKPWWKMMKTMVNGCEWYPPAWFFLDVFGTSSPMFWKNIKPCWRVPRNSLGSSSDRFGARSAAREPPSDFRLVQLARRQGPLSVSCDLELVKMGRDA